jgi:hypothetical protein
MNGFRARRESMPNLDKFSSWSPTATPTKILSRKLLSSFFRSKLIYNSQRDVEAELQGLQGVPNLKTVFVAREDSSIAGDQNTHTNEDVAKYFDQRESLGSFLAPQQIVNDINCPAPPAPKMERECMCTCDVPMGCHGPEGPAGNDGRVGASGQDGEPGRPGNDGPEGPMGDVGEVGQPGPCGMPGHAGEKGFPGEDGVPGMSGNSGPQGAQGE